MNKKIIYKTQLKDTYKPMNLIGFAEHATCAKVKSIVNKNLNNSAS